MPAKITLNLLDGDPIDGLCTLGYREGCWPVYLMLDYPNGVVWVEPLEPGVTPIHVHDGRRSMWELATTPTTAEASDLLRKLETILQAEFNKRGHFGDEIQAVCDDFVSEMTFYRPSEYFELGGEDGLDADGEIVGVWDGIQADYDGHGIIGPDTSDEQLDALEASILTQSKTSFVARLGEHLRYVRASCRENS